MSTPSRKIDPFVREAEVDLDLGMAFLKSEDER
jgi:hypothetical protein